MNYLVSRPDPIAFALFRREMKNGFKVGNSKFDHSKSVFPFRLMHAPLNEHVIDHQREVSLGEIEIVQNSIYIVCQLLLGEMLSRPTSLAKTVSVTSAFNINA